MFLTLFPTLLMSCHLYISLGCARGLENECKEKELPQGSLMLNQMDPYFL